MAIVPIPDWLTALTGGLVASPTGSGGVENFVPPAYGVGQQSPFDEGGMFLPDAPAPNPQVSPTLGPVSPTLPTGVPLPKPRPAAAAAGDSVAQGGAQQNKLANALKGVVTPAAPDVQKVTHSPSLPQLKPIAGGLGDLMAMLGVAPPKTAAPPNLPATLQQALGRG